jgi:hypothetical protein
MATKASSIDLEIAHFNNIKNKLPNSDLWNWETVDILLNMGIIQVSTAIEHAVAYAGGTTVVSEDKYDLANGDEVKAASARLRGYGKSYDAYISNTKGKNGNLRVQIYERITNKFYYFVIPHSQYSRVTYLEIPFHLNGNPKYSNHWWEWEVESFEKMSKVRWFKKDTMELI